MRKKLFKSVAILAAVSMVFCDNSIISLAGEIVPAEEEFCEEELSDDVMEEEDISDAEAEESEESIVISDDELSFEDEENVDIQEDGDSYDGEESTEIQEDGEASDGEDSIEIQEDEEVSDGELISQDVIDENEACEDSEDVESTENLLNAEDIIASGTSNNVTWVVDKDHKLTISGTGDWERDLHGHAPWYEYADYIHTGEVNLTGATDLSKMFFELWDLRTVDFNEFDTSNVTDMSGMFNSCGQIRELDISGFNTSKVTNMREMFYGCWNLSELDFSKIDTSKVTNMRSMFESCVTITELDLSNFDTSKVTDMNSMFDNCRDIENIKLSSFDTSNVTDMNSMFDNCNSLKAVDLSSFDTSNVTTMRCMFRDCPLISFDLGIWDTSNVMDMSEMFSCCSSLTAFDFCGADMSNVTDMSEMFSCCSSLTAFDFCGADMSNVTDMSGMFTDCDSLTAFSFCGADLSNVTDMSEMFWDCDSLTTVNFSGTDLSNVTDMSEMFFECQKLTAVDFSKADTSNVADMSHMFYNCNKLTELDVSGFDTSKVTDMSYMFYNCNKLTELDVSGFDTSKVTDMSHMFHYCSELTKLDVSGFDTSKVMDMSYMFSNCEILTELDVSGFDTSKVSDMTGMFYGCKSLTELDTGNFVTSGSTKLDGMFNNCNCLETLDIRNFSISGDSCVKSQLINQYGSLSKIITPKTCSCKMPLPGYRAGVMWMDSKGILYSEMPGKSKTLTCDMSSSGSIAWGMSNNVSWRIYKTGKLTIFGTGNWEKSSAYMQANPWQSVGDKILSAEVCLTDVTDLTDMFLGCSNLTSVDLSGLDTSKVTNMSCMFDGCRNLTSIDLSGFDTSNTTDMSYMFSNCSSLTSLDLSGFSTEKVERANGMFTGCENLNTLDISNFDWSHLNSTGMEFTDCKNLSRIVTPRYVKANAVVSLPSDVEWKDSNGSLYTKLPSVSTDLTAGEASTKYVITYELNGGVNSADNPYLYDKNENVVFANPAKEGFDFEGWYDKSTGEKVDGVSGRNITVKAKWIPYTYTLTLYGNGGKYTPKGSKKAKNVEKKKVSCGECVKLNGPFERKGYRLIGWTTKKNGSGTLYPADTGVSNLTVKNKGKVTLYAQWSANEYNIVYHINYGNYDSKTTSMTNYATSVKLADCPFERRGYYFKGWSLTPNGKVKYKNKAVVKNLTTSESIDLYAVWSECTYNVKFSGNGLGKGKAPAPQKGCRYDEVYAIIPENPFTCNPDYEFYMWNTKKDGSGEYYSELSEVSFVTAKNNQTITLYAIWRYKFKVAVSEDKVLETSKYYYYNVSIPPESVKKSVPGLNRKGYYIAGWATSQKDADKGKMAYKSTLKNVAGKTLYPVYKPVKYTVKFNANGGSGKMSSISATYGKSFTLKKNAFKRAGYTFKGWSRLKNATTESYVDQAEITEEKSLSAINKNVITLYAVWEKNQ